MMKFIKEEFEILREKSGWNQFKRSLPYNFVRKGLAKEMVEFTRLLTGLGKVPKLPKFLLTIFATFDISL